MASTSLAELTPDTRQRAEALLAAATAAGFKLSIVSTLRTCADQGSGGTVIIHGIPTKKAPGCRSWHVFGRAFDVMILNEPSEGRYAELGALGKGLGLEWGGDFATNYDPVHFQYRAGLRIDDLCPNPSDCESAVETAKAAQSRPADPAVPLVPAATKASSSGPAVFALGLLVGWWAARRFRSS